MSDLIGLEPNAREYIDKLVSGMSGKLTMSVSPATVDRAATASAWTRNVVVEIKDEKGRICDWLSASYATKVSIADTSTLGTATIASTTLAIVRGRAVITVSGSAAAWVAAETNTLTVGNLTIMGYTVTGATSVETIV